MAPEIRDSLSDAACRLLDDTATRVLTGAAGVVGHGRVRSGAMGGLGRHALTMTALDHVYASTAAAASSRCCPGPWRLAWRWASRWSARGDRALRRASDRRARRAASGTLLRRPLAARRRRAWRGDRARRVPRLRHTPDLAVGQRRHRPRDGRMDRHVDPVRDLRAVRGEPRLGVRYLATLVVRAAARLRVEHGVPRRGADRRVHSEDFERGERAMREMSHRSRLPQDEDPRVSGHRQPPPSRRGGIRRMAS